MNNEQYQDLEKKRSWDELYMEWFFEDTKNTDPKDYISWLEQNFKPPVKR